MEKKLALYISKHCLFAKNEKVLVAASGGVDSMVLCHLFKKSNTDFGIAHCNFKLRGKDSDEDEAFVKKTAYQWGVPYFTASFDTEKFAAQQKISIQLAARQLRYEWLWKICNDEGFDKLATAHHLDDNIETVLFNFAKGTGIKGMRGIFPKKNKLIRPLLFATKKEVLEYAENNEIQYREDSSNISEKYTRNKIRHQIIPVLETINPSFQHSAGETIRHLREVELLYEYAIGRLKSEIVKPEFNEEGKLICQKILIKKLLSSPAPSTVLFELLKPYGFNNTHTCQILQSIDNQPGSFFFSNEYRLLIDRTYLILEEYKDINKSIHIELEPGQSTYSIPDGKLTFKELEGSPVAFPKNNQLTIFDADKIVWPITLRHWQSGDVFQPLGMSGRRKKLQDLFTNEKLSRSEKEKVWVMESGGNICWVVGIRSDERFKVTDETVRYLVVEFLPSTFVE